MHKNFFLLLSILCCGFVAAQNSYRNLSSENWTFNKQNDSQKNKAKVPGTIHTDLLENQLIPDPFVGTNEKQLQWIENENWEYETKFNLTKSELKNQNIDILFEGLDTYATIFLNGKLLLETDNMFRTWNTSVKDKLQIGENHLKIIFKSASKIGKEDAKKLPYTLPGDEKVFTRKAQYQYGWDWGPRFVTCGIYKPIKLHFWNAAKIENVKYSQIELNDSKAILEFTTEINVSEVQPIELQINEKTKTFHLKKGKNKVKMQYEIAQPKRWWCNGLGIANLYPFQINISKNKKIIDSKKLNIGLRTIELIQEKDDIGKSFYFKLNGKPVFMKGANYIPPDSFLPRVTDSVYTSIVKNAVDANMNMIRVWGGGVYADDAFYEACDKNGILVWQDFMFACAMYPSDEKFLSTVKEEVIDNVNRLQNHPSIALWCGNNENDEGWKNWGWQKQYKYSEADSTEIWNGYQKLFHEVIPQTLDSLVSKEKNIYWPSSPSIGWGRKESLLQGDSHYWGVWWGMEPFEIYKKKVGRFMSEYGFQGMPNLETFSKFTNSDNLNLNSEAVKAHQKHNTGYQTIQTYMERDYKIPTKFEEYIYVSQLLQAEGMKTAIEAHRRAKPYCMGTLFWQLNDCWPVTSWSSVDYFGNWKAFQYQAKNSFENLLISVNEEEKQYKVYVVSDNLTSEKGKLEIQLIDFDGNLLWNKISEIQIDANTSKVYFQIDKKEFEKFNLKQAVLIIKFNEVKTNYFFEKPKDLELKNPTISIKVLNETTIQISTYKLAKNVFLSQEETSFSDNYFDLLPNEKRIIKFSKPVKDVKTMSLFDTMK
ncbi:beta-mannosidase [Flavobacterium facile]|uniref:beta-mannosidase n=1 Tax=Flavobacterium facile TaxID=2893174 RepID=UPI002E79A1A3|nr:glycoside hydrolase family 2 protein [Flavobacterium sp. T-12]